MGLNRREFFGAMAALPSAALAEPKRTLYLGKGLRLLLRKQRSGSWRIIGYIKDDGTEIKVNHDV